MASILEGIDMSRALVHSLRHNTQEPFIRAAHSREIEAKKEQGV